MTTPARRIAAVLVALLSFGLCGGNAQGDVVTTADGLVLEGRVTRDGEGRYVVSTPQGETVLEAARVRSVRAGEGPRSALTQRAAALAEADAAGWFRLALEAEAQGLPDLARDAYEHVVALEPEHGAARRALGQEKLDGTWLDAAEARRQRGLVLYRGEWLLPAEVEVRARKAPAALEIPQDVARTRDVIRTLAVGDAVLERAARLALAQTPAERKVVAALGTLYDREPAVRETSARLLGEIGDEATLRPLLLSGARDASREVRREAVLAAASYGHDDVAIPYVRALQSEHLGLVANAAEALGWIGDPRAIGYVVRRISSHGSSTRNFVSFLNQVSYVRDYDVEIAQASNIANPDVATILDGVILDVKVLDAAYEKTWIEPLLVDTVSRLAGRSFAGPDEVLAWYSEEAGRLPDFPKDPAARKTRGRVLGAQ